MHSDGLPWDFYATWDTSKIKESQRVLLLLFPDPFLERMLLYRKQENVTALNDYQVLAGYELNPDWPSNNLELLNLFAQNEAFLIISGESLSPATFDSLLALEPENVSKPCVFSFVGNSEHFKKLKSRGFDSYEVKTARFWEGAQLLGVCCEYFSMSLSHEVEAFLLGALTFDTAVFFNALNLIRLFATSGQSPSLSDVKAIVTPQKFDFFELGKSYGKKDLKAFYRSLSNSFYDFEALVEFFRFMGGHLLKIYDPSYMDKKNRPSKYDKEIIHYSKIWKKEEIIRDIKLFSSLQCMAKEKNELLYLKLNDLTIWT